MVALQQALISGSKSAGECSESSDCFDPRCVLPNSEVWGSSCRCKTGSVGDGFTCQVCQDGYVPNADSTICIPRTGASNAVQAKEVCGASCFYAVQAKVGMPGFTKVSFDTSRQESFKIAVKRGVEDSSIASSVIGVNITSIVEVTARRRRLLATSLEVSFKIYFGLQSSATTGVAKIGSQSFNDALARENFPGVQLLESPTMAIEALGGDPMSQSTPPPTQSAAQPTLTPMSQSAAEYLSTAIIIAVVSGVVVLAGAAAAIIITMRRRKARSCQISNTNDFAKDLEANTGEHSSIRPTHPEADGLASLQVHIQSFEN